MRACGLNPLKLADKALEALKLAYEECPHSEAGAKIIVAFQEILRLQQELETAATACGRKSAQDIWSISNSAFIQSSSDAYVLAVDKIA